MVMSPEGLGTEDDKYSAEKKILVVGLKGLGAKAT
jgi:hypothetical protein